MSVFVFYEEQWLGGREGMGQVRESGTYFRIIWCEFQCGTKWDQLDPTIVHDRNDDLSVWLFS